MYQIISMTGEILSETDSLIYSKFNPENNSWISASEKDAECVIVKDRRCSIFGKSCTDSEKIVFVKKIDGAEKISKLAKDSIQISADTQ